MRIITVSITSNNGIVTLHMDLIKSLRTKPNIGRPAKVPRATMLAEYADVEQRVAMIHAKIDTDRELQRFFVKRMDVTLSGPAKDTFMAIRILDECFKPDMSDFILIDEEANLEKLIPELLTGESSLDSKWVTTTFNFPMTLNEYIQDKKQTKPEYFYQNIATQILNNPENKQYKFLSAFYLLDPENTDKTNILQYLSLFFSNPEHGKIRKDLMTSLNNLAREAFIKPCLGKIAEDNHPYNEQYTEIETFYDSQFTLTEEKCVQINPLKSDAYKHWYMQGKRNFGKLKDEWIHMGKILGMEFSEDSIWDECIILTKESSDFFIQKGLLYDEKYMEDMRRQENLEKIMLFRNGFFYDNHATNRLMNSDVINKITADFVQLSASP